MRSTTLAVAITCTLAFTATASAEPKQIWDLGGFTNPESAVVENGVIYVSNVNGGADLGFVPATRMVIIPMMKDNRVLAFTLD